MGVVDPVGSQWLHLNILNVIMFLLWLITREHFKIRNIAVHKIVVVLLLFNLWGFISFFYANNTVEVLIESFRISTLLGTLLILTNVIRQIKNPLKFITQIFILSLALESLLIIIPTINTWAKSGIVSRELISKGISTNINIAAFSILYKIPFLIYVYVRNSMSKHKILGVILMILSISSIFLLMTRGAILGLLFIPIVYVVIPYLTRTAPYNKKNLLWIFILPLLVSYILVNQLNSSEQSVLNRVATISKLDKDQSINYRLGYYKYSVNQILSNPLIGLGYGNWKIESIPGDIKQKNTYIVPYHSHNDFLQIGAELGIIGLFIYSAFFVILLIILLKNKRKSEETLLFGLFFMAYLIDANLNFPIARPINQIPLLIVSSILLYSYRSKLVSVNPKLVKSIVLIIILVQPLALYSNYRVFKSFVEQKQIFYDFNEFDFTNTPEGVKDYEDRYPNISVTTIPLKTLKALYLKQDELETGIKMTRESIKHNPHLYFSEAMLSLYYSKLGRPDSAKYYAEKAYKNAPSIDLHAAFYLPFLKADTSSDEYKYAINNLKLSNSPTIWKRYFEMMLSFKDSLDQNEKDLVKFAKNKFPDFSFFNSVELTKDYSKEDLLRANKFAQEAKEKFKLKSFSEAISLFKKANEIIPTEPGYIENIARSYLLLEDYKNAILFFQKLISDFGISTGLPEFYIGSIKYKLGQKEEGCKFLFKSVEANYSRAKILYQKACLNN